MSVKINGLKKLQSNLEDKVGRNKMEKIVDRALLQGAEVFVKELKQNFQSFRDTGASIDEITISEPTTGPNGRQVNIHWKGPDGRYRIIHINEWGTIKNPNPRGKGKIALSLNSGKSEYRKVIKKIIEGEL